MARDEFQKINNESHRHALAGGKSASGERNHWVPSSRRETISESTLDVLRVAFDRIGRAKNENPQMVHFVPFTERPVTAGRFRWPSGCHCERPGYNGSDHGSGDGPRRPAAVG